MRFASKKKYILQATLVVAVVLTAAFIFAITDKTDKKSPVHGNGDHPNERASDHRELKVAFEIKAAGDGAKESQPIREGGYAQVVFRVIDEKTGDPVSSLGIASWISLTDETAEQEACEDRIKRYVQGLLGLHADIDLNKHFILVMNSDRTISVIDPLMGMSGITHLFDMIVLPERGEDWTLSPDEKHLFVSVPRAGVVSKIDLGSFEVVENLPAGNVPVRLALHPNGRQLWVGNDAMGRGGITVIDLQDDKNFAFVETGAGHHEIAFSEDGKWAYVTNSTDSTVSVVDTSRLSKTKDLPTGKNPIAVAFSKTTGTAFVLAEGDGAVTIVDGNAPRILQTIQTDPGPIALRFDHRGRWGFLANFGQNRVDVIDATKGEVVHRIPVGRQPHQIAFTQMHAYVRHLGTSDVALIKLTDLGQEKLPEIIKVPFGNKAPGEYRYTSLADSISAMGHMAAVVGANPTEKVLFHYMEGMMVPMGSYSTYGRTPRAVMLTNRAVREISEGVYAAKIRVPKAGIYNVSLLIKNPRAIKCFNFEAQEQTLTASGERIPTEVSIEYLDPHRKVEVNRPFTVTFKLNLEKGDSKAQPINGLKDVTVTATRMPGNRSQRHTATDLGEGTYEVQITAGEPGAYFIFVSVPSLQMDSTNMKYLVLNAVPSSS